MLDKVVEEAKAAKDKEGSLAIQFSLADLLWEKDEARARRLFSSIVSTVERERCGSCGFFDLSVIAARDAKLAVGLDGLSNRLFTPFGGNRIYEHLANQYPDEALRIGRRAVANDTYFEYLDSTAGFLANSSARGNRGGRLGKLYAANRSYGANLARDISAKLRGGRLDGPIQYPNYNAVANILSIPPHYVNAVNAALPTSPFFSPNANRPPGNYAANTVTRTANYPTNRASANYSRRPAPSGIPFSAAAGLLAAAVDSAEQNPGEPPMLTVDEMRSLASAMVQALIRTRRFDTYQVLGVWPELKKYAPRETARLQRLLTRAQRSELSMPPSPFEFPQANIGDVTDDFP
ncbi:MAG TPA: hypothetical protein VNA17_10755 [Pyrinomonadaceae bacterium]|nr:hypothetical protein [Pyrinomonadaceae bacterium]